MTSRRERYAAATFVDRLIGAIVGRRSKWIFVLAGAVLTLALGPLAGKLAPLENNSPTSFLPAAAASTRVLKYEQAHGQAAAQPAIVVYERRAGLTATDRRTIALDRAELEARRLVDAGTPTPVVFASNGRAAFFSIPISGAIPSTTLGSDVSQIRAVVARGATPATAEGPRDALRVAVGGPAGSAADATEAFAGIDTTLLAVTVVIVALLLLLIYRSPVLWLVPLVSVGLAAVWSQGVAYFLARSGFVVNGMTVGILTVLVFGAGTDYALLLIARYREELRRQADAHLAMAVALRRAGPAIVASGLTVVLGLLCLLLAQLNDIAALGPACAGAIVCALAAQLVVLPALLLVLGRRVFWPFIPRLGDEVPEESGLFGKLGRLIRQHRRPVWVGIVLLMGGCCLGLLTYQGGLTQQNGFVGKVDSVEAQNLLTVNFPEITAPRANVLVLHPSATAPARVAALHTPGVAAVSAATPVGRGMAFDVTLTAGKTENAASNTVILLRQHLARAVGSQALVGGQIATNVDIADAASHDRAIIIPVVAGVILVMLGFVLRSLVAPFVLVATVLLSFFASLGVTAVVARYLFGFAGFDPSVPIFGFVFLVALGVDYNIFLMLRVREEASAGHAAGVVKGLAVTGSVITSAGVVLAATFSVLAVLPLVALVEVGFLIAFGVLIDTVLIRSALVPALSLEIGSPLWWPSCLWRNSRDGVLDASRREC